VTNPVLITESEVVKETARRVPAWCVQAYRVGNTWCVVDERGKYWRAHQGLLTEVDAPRVVDVLIPLWGPCEEMSEALLTGL
jgi:hypothetical protein